MSFLDLPAELQLRILRFCTQNDLVSLSRVNKSLQPIAEYTLYGQLYNVIGVRGTKIPRQFSWEMNRKQSLLTTLISDPRRASLVRRLGISYGDAPLGYVPNPSDPAQREGYVIQITDVLRTTQNLTELRIMLSRGDCSQERINEVIIRSKCFRLRTLYCDHSLDLEGIVAEHTQLQLLGIYYFRATHWIDSAILTRIERLHGDAETGRGRTFPNLFLLDYAKHDDYFWLTLFPALYPLGQISTICRDILTSLNEDPLHVYSQYVYQFEHVFYPSFSLPDVSESTAGLVRETMEVLAYYLPHSQYLQITITGKVLSEKPWRRPELVDSLGAFERLRRLIFRLPNCEGQDQIDALCTDLKSCLSEGWTQRLVIGFSCGILEVA
ncbi:hypothetical protein AX15_005360 [Amanita polypyramis BW_CC]|nr:hypothetical protein AX15_005360 [Amanita polypyramis BW_CC]